MFKFGNKSKAELIGVHAHLIILTTETLLESDIDFVVFDGLRTEEEQAEYVARGVSWTMNSRHLTGHAVDLVPYINGKQRWDSEKAFQHIGALMRAAALRHSISIKWGANVSKGGDWQTRNDMAHFELDKKKYPATQS